MSVGTSIFTDTVRGRGLDRAGAAGFTVAYFGSTVPSELIEALGGAAIRIVPRYGEPTPYADEWLDDDFSWEHRSVADQILCGDWEAADLVVLDRSAWVVYTFLREIYRRGAGAKVPPVHALDLMATTNHAVETYNRQQIARLLDRLVRLGGALDEQELLARARAIGAVRRQAARRVQDARERGQIAPQDGLEMLTASWLMEPGRYAAAVDAALDGMADTAELDRSRRVLLLSSESIMHGAFHRAADTDLVICWEDDVWGARAADLGLGEHGDIVESVRDGYMASPSSAAANPRTLRQRWSLSMLEGGVPDAVVFHASVRDRQWGWDYPHLVRAAKTGGVRQRFIMGEVADESVVRDALSALADAQ